MKRKEYRIRHSDGRFLNAGTDNVSWFSIDEARRLVNYDLGDKILWCNGGDILGETF